MIDPAMRSTLRWVTAAVVIFALTSCGPSEPHFEDLSGVEPYVSSLADSCNTQVELRVLGAAGEAKDQVDHLFIAQAPVPGGPFLFDRPLPAGAVLTLLGARRCTNCKPERIERILAIEHVDEYAPFEAYALEALMGDNLIRCGPPKDMMPGPGGPPVGKLPRRDRKPGAEERPLKLKKPPPNTPPAN